MSRDVSTPICCSCFRKLTPEERFYYETRCEGCESKWSLRVDRWKNGLPDAEFDTLFGIPADLHTDARRAKIAAIERDDAAKSVRKVLNQPPVPEVTIRNPYRKRRPVLKLRKPLEGS